MTFFTGEYECKLDAKGRMVLPAKIKSNLPSASVNELVLRKGYEPTITVYTMVEYKKIHSKFSSLSEFNPEQRKLKRQFFRSIAQVELDSNGRFLLPKSMIGHAKLEKEVLVLGLGSSIELWNPEVYDHHNDDGDFSALAQKYLDE